ncbi:MAG: aminotransferase class III-fold pyridoxal phosphate-dependent enzyme, partial [Chlorobi bacterium]|nr:aminotransferase class III-fold pyridoxal phosphate-dependent enzyme [Chlorobiota bacterium]
IEPIQGEGGDNHFRTEFMQSLRQICDENEALLIFDEVQSGVGITGKWWAYQHSGVTPDILAFGKKMQVCGILATDRIDDVADNVFHTSSRINSTWGGNLTDMVRSTRYLEIIEEENMVENAANMGKVLIKRLEKMEKEFPKLVSAVRGKGLFCAFNMSDADVRADLINKCYENGLIILSCGKTAVRFRPPLNINEKDLNGGLDIVADVLKTL